MIEAGYRKKPTRKPLTPLERIRRLVPRLTMEERRDLARELLIEPPAEPPPDRTAPAALVEGGRP
jgi:hypothetical protein